MYLQTVVSGVVKDGDKIDHIQTVGKFGPGEFAAKTFIDSTGDGDLSVLAGCPWEFGREGDKLVQPVTLMFIIDGWIPIRPCFAVTRNTIQTWATEESIWICVTRLAEAASCLRMSILCVCTRHNGLRREW